MDTIYKIISLGIVFLLAMTITAPDLMGQAMGEEEKPKRRKSPVRIAQVKHNDTYIKVVYGQPYKRGRDIFGGLVPYDKVWRTGANEATEITVTRDITFGGKKVEAGTYALFTIPGKEEWTIILNNVLGQWGAFEYNKSKDYKRITVPAEQTDQTVEAFTMNFSKPKNNKTTLSLMWDKTKVDIPIEFGG